MLKVNDVESTARHLRNLYFLINLSRKRKPMPTGYMYILKCSDDSFYTGSTINLEERLLTHQSGNGANYTKKRLPIELLYYEFFERIDLAFEREKQVQGWSRAKKLALINGNRNELPLLSLNRKKREREEL